MDQPDISKESVQAYLEDHPFGNASASQRFVVHAPLIAMKSLGGRKLVTLAKRTIGNIVESYGELGRPGLVMATVDDECYLIWMRDLEERAELLPVAVAANA